MKHLKSFALIVIMTVMAAPASAQFDNVGSIDFPTSVTGEAQQHFLRGVAILHSFGWEQAQEQFQAAQEIEPDFALAYWGESLAYNHPLFSGMDATEPRNALQRLGPTPEIRLAKAPTDREKGFLNAVEILWGEGEVNDRKIGYMEAMELLYEKYPDDHEVASFYALSMLSARAASGGDLDNRMAIRAGTIALDIFHQNPNHPGAAHYTIHSFDDPIHAPLALEAAYRFAEIAPAVSHARHMPTHIFIQHGMWDLVSYNNQYAYDAARELWRPGQSMGDAIHSLDWGQYGDLQLGDYEKARLWIERIETMSTQGGFAEGGARGQGGAARAMNTVGLTRNRYIVDTEEWQIQDITEDSSDHQLLSTALSAYHMEDQATLQAAEQELKRRVDEGEDGYTAIMANQVSALLHAGMDHPDVAVRFFDQAVEIIQPMAPPRGSANPIKPLYEMYGEVLVDLGRHEDAITQFETSLLRMPNRPRSLLGMARAQAATGHTAVAAEYYQMLVDIWRGDNNFEGVTEARSYLAGNPGGS
ncbi:MAG: tetratricopeptide repeat protein [Pseudomonadales bacterium]|nr:tetratricopeptide repeat protein [Pseudomonadales bacterium]